MAKNIVGIFILCFILFGGNIRCQPVLETFPVLPDITLLRGKIIDLANSQVGIKEATGNNDGKDILKYQKAAGLKSGMAWCAAFATWCHEELNIPNPKSGRAADWFKTNLVYRKGLSRINTFEPRAGQVAAETNGTRISHISIIERRVDKLHYITIGGNETNSVRKAIKKETDIWAVADYVGYKEILKAMK